MDYSSCRYTLLAGLLLAGLLCEAIDDYNILDFDLASKHELWMARHRRVYKDEAEKAKRFQIFKENVKFIQDFNNAGNHSYTLGINQFTDLTTEEFAYMYLMRGTKLPTERELGKLRRTSKYSKIKMNPNVSREIPKSVDWRAVGAVTPIKNQGQCGCGWAFCTVATVEGLHMIKKGVLYELSEQQLLDCDSENGGCSSGFPDVAMKYIVKNGGITLQSNYAYVGSKEKCDSAKENATMVKITGARFKPYMDEHMLMGFVAEQPVVVMIDALRTEFKHYEKGIYDGPCGTGALVNHSVAVVGYGEEEDGKDKYWILKNSWGTEWGESGFMRLKKDTRAQSGWCGVAAWPSWPEM